MASLWADAVAGGWSVFADLMGDLLPVIGVAIGLAIADVALSWFFGGD